MRVVKWKKLKEKAHRIALENPEIQLVEAWRGGWKKGVVLVFRDRKNFINAYGLAEEEIFDELGESFTIVDAPHYESFSWDTDIIK